MNDKEKKAILKLKEYVKSQKEELNMFGYITTLEIDLKNTETVLNLIENQKAEIEKKDKQIDLMAEEIAFNHDINSYEDVLTIKKQLKEKYEKKAEEDK